MKILFFGDIVGKIGRQAIKQILPDLKKEFNPDLTIANAENIAHGTGITEKTINELQRLGIDYFTAGDHVLDKPEAENVLNKKNSTLIRPANYAQETPGVGSKVVEVGSRKILLVNLMGQVFIKTEAASPFEAIDKIINDNKDKDLSGIIVDFHAEATSEKIAFGWYVDGKVSAVLGTHTHVPTADAKILPQGTAYVSDVGMVGATDSVLGMTKELSIGRFLGQEITAERIPEKGEVNIGAVLIEIDPKTKKSIHIQRLDRTIEV